MALLALAFLGGILTIISPCILPVLPFVFAKADQPFRRTALPLLAGIALTFTVLAGVATVGGNWIVQANQYGRWLSLAVLAIFGLTLLWGGLADRLSRPLVRLGSQLSESAAKDETSLPRSLLLGVATGLLWAPCAGPILGLILTGAAVEGANSHTTLLLLAYALGAATSLAIALLAGGRVFQALKRSLGAEVWIRRALGVAVLAGVAAIAFGLDRGYLTQVSLASTSELEQSLINRVQPPPTETNQDAPAMMMKNGDPGMMMMSASGANNAAGPRTMPDLDGATAWLNSPALTPETLKGKVVLVDFWTYSCINCIRTMPYIRAWADKYKDSGLVVIGIHTPEFPFEKDLGNVKRAVSELEVKYTVALDNDYAIWKAFHNNYWPADYLVDAKGNIRHHHFGEGKYDETEQQIQALLKERNGTAASNLVSVTGQGAQAAPDANVESPETYLGFDRADSFLSPGGIRQDMPFRYRAPAKLELNQWAFAGNWTSAAQLSTLNTPGGKIIYRFHARDVHLVLGPGSGGKPIRFRIRIDGKAPGENQGVDTDTQGNGTVTDYRLYQLIRQKGAVEDRTFEIEFLDVGVQAFAFTFG